MPVLNLTKTDHPDPVVAGATLTYTLTINNVGNAPATGVTIVDDYDESVLTIVDDDGGFNNGNTIVWNGGITIPAGGSISRTIIGVVAATAADGTVITNSACVSSSEGAEDSESEETTISSQAPALSIIKIDSPDPVLAGANLTYTVSITNSGNAAATDVVVTDTYDVNFRFGEALPAPDEGTNNRWTFDSIGANQTVTISIIGTVLSNGETSLTNSVSYTSSNAGSGADSEVTMVLTPGAPVLTIDKIGTPDPVTRGGSLTYLLTVSNVGSVAATGVTVVDDYDEAVLTVTDAGGGVDDGRTITWNAGLTIPPGGSLSYNISATVSSGASPGSIFFNSANVTCAEGASASVTVETRVAGAGGGGGGGGGGAAPRRYLTVDWEGHVTRKPLDSNDRLTDTLLALSPDGRHSLELQKGTLAPTTPDGKRHYLITIRELEEIPPLPENSMVAGTVFNITPSGAAFDRNVFLTLGFNPLELPENAISATMAYFDETNEIWVTVESQQGGVAELGTMTAPIMHFTPFAVVVTLAPPVPPPPPPHFVASALGILTSVEKIWDPITFVTITGESATITATVVNDGGQEGSYEVTLKLNGQTVDSETVTLAAGESRQVTFTVAGLGYGRYEVELAGLRGAFSVSRTINWWLITALVVVIGLIVWGSVRISKRQRTASQG